MAGMPHLDWLSGKNKSAFLIHVMTQAWGEKSNQLQLSESQVRIWNKLVRKDGIPGLVVTPRTVQKPRHRQS
jgi:hypothetical protein